jgi:hypothetical protein
VTQRLLSTAVVWCRLYCTFAVLDGLGSWEWIDESALGSFTRAQSISFPRDEGSRTFANKDPVQATDFWL